MVEYITELWSSLAVANPVLQSLIAGMLLLIFSFLYSNTLKALFPSFRSLKEVDIEGVWLTVVLSIYTGKPVAFEITKIYKAKLRKHYQINKEHYNYKANDVERFYGFAILRGAFFNAIYYGKRASLSYSGVFTLHISHFHFMQTLIGKYCQYINTEEHRNDGNTDIVSSLVTHQYRLCPIDIGIKTQLKKLIGKSHYKNFNDVVKNVYTNLNDEQREFLKIELGTVLEPTEIAERESKAKQNNTQHREFNL